VLDHLRPFLTSRKYARRIRAYAFVGLLAATLFAVSGCGESNERSAQPAGGSSTTTATTSTTTGGIDPLEGADTAPVEADSSGTETALLERIEIGRHEGYDRVVFQFRDQLPGYRVEYVQRPLKEDGSGNPVEI